MEDNYNEQNDYYYYKDDNKKSDNSGNGGSDKYESDPRFTKPEKKNGFGKKVIKAIALGLVFGLVAGAGFQGSSYLVGRFTGKSTSSQIEEQITDSEKTADPENKLDTTDTTATIASLTDVSELVQNVMPSVVSVTNISVTQYRTLFGTYAQDSTSCGTGFIFDQDDDYIYIATNNHVVSGSNSLTVAFCDDTSVAAEIVGTNENQDLAVICVAISDVASDTLDQIKIATLGSSTDLMVGEPAIVIGNALGYGQSVTTGVISAVDREVSITDNNTTYTNNVIQTDAAVNPGNSGGPLIDMNGQVIGIVSAKFSSTSVEGVGYAIPISSAWETIQELKDNEVPSGSSENESDAYLGIAGLDITNSLASKYNKPVGVYISSVIEGTAAEAAGIEQGDVITGFDGETITSMEQIKAALADMEPGDKVAVKVAKASDNYNEVTYTVILGSKN